jgi:hypothetical protein
MIIYTYLFLSYFIISAALREAYEVGEKLNKLHTTMGGWGGCLIQDGCHAIINFLQTKTVSFAVVFKCTIINAILPVSRT